MSFKNLIFALFAGWLFSVIGILNGWDDQTSESASILMVMLMIIYLDLKGPSK